MMQSVPQASSKGTRTVRTYLGMAGHVDMHYAACVLYGLNKYYDTD